MSKNVRNETSFCDRHVGNRLRSGGWQVAGSKGYSPLEVEYRVRSEILFDRLALAGLNRSFIGMVMMKQTIVIGTVVLSLAHSVFGDGLQLDVTTDRSHIRLGESITLSVRVSGTTKPPEPDLSKISNCKIRFQGSRADRRTTTAIIGGKLTKKHFVGRAFTYVLTPGAAGRITAGPVTLNLPDETLTHRGPTIEVARNEGDDLAMVRLTPSKRTVLVSECFDITLAVALRRLTGEHGDIDPLDPEDPPKITAPYLNGGATPGLETPNVSHALRQRLKSWRDTPGFMINSYEMQVGDPADRDKALGSVASMARRKAKFALDRKPVEKDGKRYMEYAMSLKYVPKEEGDYSFGPALCKGKIVVAIDAAGGKITKPVFASGPAVTVHVMPPPEEGRPRSYTGGVGTNLIVEAALDAKTCSVGDPLRLTVAISGSVSIDNMHSPRLNAQPDIVRHFKIYGDTVQGIREGGRKEYVYTIRPTTVGTIELPPIEISYYHINRRVYETVRTVPIPLRVRQAFAVADDIIVDTASNLTAEAFGKKTGSDMLAIAPLDMSPAGAKADGFPCSRWHLALAAAGPLAYLCLLVFQRARRNTDYRTERRKRRNALRKAQICLDDAEATAAYDSKRASVAVCGAIKTYVADRFRASAAGLTPADVKRLLRDRAIDDVLSDQIYEILERNFDAIYARETRQGSACEDCRRARQLLTRIEDTVRGKGGALITGSKTALVLLYSVIPLCVGSSLVLADSDLQRRFLWNEANAKAASAGTEEDFLRAAEAYAELIDSGVRNGPAFYNLGTALLMAKQYDAALTALAKAERYVGRNEDVRQNMRSAIAGKRGTERAWLPWFRLPLFWHYGLPASTRTTVAVSAFAAGWVALILRAMGRHRLSRRLLIVSLFVLTAFGFSVVATLYQEASEPTPWPDLKRMEAHQ